MRMMDGERVARDAPAGERRTGWLATGGVIGAVLASACCIGPPALLLRGVSGAWIGNLVALEPAEPVFAAVALVCIGLGFHRLYVTAPVACETGSYGARPASALVTKTALWLATLLVLAALTIDWWAPLLYWGDRAMQRRSLIAATSSALGLGGLLAGTATWPGGVRVVAADAAVPLATVTFDVDGMWCALCPFTVKTAMERVEGVRSVEVDHRTRSATVAFDPTLTRLQPVGSASFLRPASVTRFHAEAISSHMRVVAPMDAEAAPLVRAAGWSRLEKGRGRWLWTRPFSKVFASGDARPWPAAAKTSSRSVTPRA